MSTPTKHIEHERKCYNARVDSWNIKQNEQTILKNAFNKIVEGGLSAVRNSSLGMGVILDDRQFENIYGNELWQIKKFDVDIK